MFAKPQTEHQWFDPMIGHWTVDSKCQMPDQSTQQSAGQMVCQSLGGLWLLMEGKGTDATAGDWSSMMTLGFDPQQKAYVGTFVASMMTHLWLYQGAIDESGKRLILNVDGPTFDGEEMTKYQDIIEILSDDHWVLSSHMVGEDDNWIQFMTADHRRVKKSNE
jgi:hypothetical protein